MQTRYKSIRTLAKTEQSRQVLPEEAFDHWLPIKGQWNTLIRLRICTLHDVACLKLNVRDCGDVVNAFMQKLKTIEHLQIA